MSKRTKTLLLALIGLVVLVGVFFAVKLLMPGDAAKGSSSETVSSTTVSLVSMSSEELSSIQVKRGDDGFTLRMADGQAVIDGLEGLPLDSEKVNSVISQATAMTAKEMIEENPANLGTYGLDKPSYTVTVTKTDGTSFTFNFGLESAASYGTYVKLDEGKEVYLVYTSELSGFAYNPKDFISTKIVPDITDSADFKSITFSGADYKEPLTIEAYSFDEDEDPTYSYFTYGITSPSLKPVDTELILGYVDKIIATASTDVLVGNYTDEQLKEYGLDQPAANIVVTFGEQYEEDTVFSFKLSFKDNTVYAICNDVPIIYTLSKADWMTLQYQDLVHSLFVLPTVYDVSKVTVNTNGKTYAFDVSGENSENITYNGTSIERTPFTKFYQLLIGACHDGNYVPDAKPEGDPLLTITFDYRNGSDSDTLQFYTASTRRLYVALNGKIEFTMMSSYLEKVQAACEQVINGETPNPDWKI